MSSPRALLVRSDNLGDVLLTGPAVRAVAASGLQVTFLCGPNGRAAAEELPGVDTVWEFRAPWIDPAGHPVVPAAVEELVAKVRAARFDQAVIMTSFHQSSLPTALLLRLSGVPIIAGNSEDFPGTLLDLRHRPDDDQHEVERNLSLVATLGHRLPDSDDGALRIVRRGHGSPPLFAGPYIVVHPGASVPARSWGSEANRAVVDLLVRAGWRVAVTGGPDERRLTAAVAATDRHGGRVVDLGGATGFTELADVIAGAAAIVVGNTGAAHLAAAVGTPVVSLFAPTIPAVRWRPWRVPTVILGDQDIPCRGCRARTCPVANHPCLSMVDPDEVVTAVGELTVATGRVLAVEDGAA